MQNKRMGFFCISEQLLCQALALPEGTKIKHASNNPVEWGFRRGIFIVVEHPDLDEVEDGVKIPELSPRYECIPDKQPSDWLKFDWGKK